VIVTETDDLRSLREVTRDFFALVEPHDAVERKSARIDRALWSRACQELGCAGVAVPEEHGGLGIGFGGLAIVLEEAGRALAPVPLLGSVVLAQTALLAAGDRSVLDDVLPGLLAGDRVAALATQDGPGHPAPARPATARRGSDGWRVDGEKCFVLDGMSADLLLVTAETAEGVSLLLVDPTADGVTRAGAGAMDLTRDFARIDLAGAPARLVGEPSAWPGIAERLGSLRTVAVACENLGGAERCLHEAVEYAKVRVQFGRPIGSFQAIKHRCADLAADVDDARSAVAHAVWAAAEAPEQLPAAAAMAAAVTAATYRACSAENVQIHGGIGFTWEHTAHLYFRRARSNSALFGDDRHHKEALLAALGI
jgi:alkylation response protein AidB-like acyl-CoA dehydrogenase